MKTLKELKASAREILEIPDVVGDFGNVSFFCGSGGSPANHAGLPEVYRAEQKEYDTDSNGSAYQGEVVILCKDTKTTDAKGNPIYVTPSGVVFVFEYFPGTPASFDRGCLREPSLR